VKTIQAKRQKAPCSDINRDLSLDHPDICLQGVAHRSSSITSRW
jgi:hypothetical protein